MQPPLNNGVLEDFRLDFQDCWHRLPNKGFFFVLLAAWLALFQYLGNSTLGYVHSASLFRFMSDAYHPYLLGWLRTLDLDAISNWMSQSDEGHCVLVPFLVLGLFWWKRKELLALPLRMWWPGLSLVALALLLHIFAFLVQQPKLSIIALFTGLYGLMGMAWGPAWLRAGFFPFFLLFFCVPLGDQAQPVTFRLRLLVCRLVEFVGNSLLAIDVQREGTMLSNPVNHYQYEVAAACSGMRSLMATFGLATLYAFLGFRSYWRRVLLIASALPLAVLGNLARMLTIIVAAELGGQEWGNRVHDGGPVGIFSLLPYVPAFLGLIGLGYVLREAPLPTAAHPGGRSA
jgi:exosortase